MPVLSAHVFYDAQTVAVLTVGDSLGESALLDSLPRNASVVTGGVADLYVSCGNARP